MGASFSSGIRNGQRQERDAVQGGILVVDKEEGWTSHDVVAKIRRLTGVRKVGHTGTLDPMATGVLVLCVGRATRAAEFLAEDDKEYVAEVHLGVETDTLDRLGQVIGERSVPSLSVQDIERVGARFRGRISQVPPMFSAVKQAGRKLYEWAREGRTVARLPKEVLISKLDVIAYAEPVITLRVTCSKGTYVRSLAHDIGEALGCGAHLSTLRRTRCGRFRHAEALTVGHIEAYRRAGRLTEKMTSIYDALDRFPSVCLSMQDEGRFRHGAPVGWSELPDGGFARVCATTGLFIGIGKWDQESKILRPVKLFV